MDSTSFAWGVAVGGLALLVMMVGAVHLIMQHYARMRRDLVVERAERENAEARLAHERAKVVFLESTLKRERDAAAAFRNKAMGILTGQVTLEDVLADDDKPGATH